MPLVRVEVAVVVTKEVDSVAAPEESVEESATTGADWVDGGGGSALEIGGNIQGDCEDFFFF